jgi:transposase-like protein
VLVELGLVEQRHKAVLEVMAGATITDVAQRNGVTRQTVHRWLRCYASVGLAGLADHSSRSARCPHQMSPGTEVRLLELREEHPSRLTPSRYQLLSEDLVRGQPLQASVWPVDVVVLFADRELLRRVEVVRVLKELVELQLIGEVGALHFAV